ncbi:M23 family metallopeptidase, partial [Streptomyces goshikiensis]|uniref:M23 family metallopeptidase n=1 Tax=Streptomyces goshikiensis TaxID=1942 RepID=UPI003675CF27
RPKTSSISRGFAAAGTAGAPHPLPLRGATGATAAGAPAAAPAAAPVQAPVTAAAAAPQVRAAAPQAVETAPAVYTVVSGDFLSKIAAERQLEGGWERLYEDNREAVGANPSLIHPGLKLTLGAKGAAAQSAPAPQRAQKPAGQSAAGQSAEQPAQRSAPAPKAKPKTAPAAPAKKQQSAGASTAGQTASFVAPVGGGGISTQYKTPGAMWSSGYHTGADFIASSGTTVRAVGAGTVVSAGWAGSYGNEVVIRHADGKYSQYGHLSQLSVSVGQSVTAGKTIGLSGSTGNSTGPHLHFEIRTGPSYGSDIDPIAYLRSKGVSI